MTIVIIEVVGDYAVAAAESSRQELGEYNQQLKMLLDEVAAIRKAQLELAKCVEEYRKEVYWWERD